MADPAADAKVPGDVDPAEIERAIYGLIQDGRAARAQRSIVADILPPGPHPPVIAVKPPPQRRHHATERSYEPAPSARHGLNGE